MSFGNVAHGRITEARNVLIQRRRQTNEPKEKAAIDEAIAELNDVLGLVNQAGLLDAAAMVVGVTSQLEKVVTSASLDPLSAYLKEMGDLFEKVGNLLTGAEMGEHLDQAHEVAPAVPVVQPPSESAVVSPSESPGSPSEQPVAQPESGKPNAEAIAEKPPQTPLTDLPPIGTGLKFAPLRAEYESWFNALVVRPEYTDKVKWHVDQLLRYQARYRAVSSKTNNMPWAMIGVIHAMECGFRFTGHLHNGDPLTSRTRQVPQGRPPGGSPPFSWEQSAVDALTMEGQALDKVSDWSIPHMLYLLERYNGLGYRKKGRPTPYLWSFSNLFEKGKYVSDGRFDANAVSKQCGAAVMLKALREKGVSLS